MIIWNTLGLCGESGELVGSVDVIGRIPFDDSDHNELKKEFGDIMWYIAAIATKMDVELIDFEVRYEPAPLFDDGRPILIRDVAIELTLTVGQFAEYVKKGILHQHGFVVDKASNLLFEVYQRVRDLLERYEYSVEDCWQLNIEKLMKRYPDGYSAESSRARVDIS